ncbi:ABC-three component system protein [Aliarcobacter vitoriensis]|uniref:ABC-three component systems C-terminal domain-containing protein n=1 Tax=Aliarcobacter vitoriensis TaxID=2011099 RepID=A0A366MTD1_9BACT|nr:ABC-three component system protein [Aliarcobacter vitoriensis]RBQ28759.1 hypothetical protein CRU91_07900 [Aliarcobacter vitoriensis]
MSDNRNATSSWSGYSHQGSLGIFVALQKINQLFADDKSLDGWKVIYENAEDFDIQNNGTVDSRHQVKAYKDAKYPNDIKDVLSIQNYELVEGKKKLTVKGFQIRSFDNLCNPLNIEVDDESRYLHVITEILGLNLSEDEFTRTYSGCTYVSNPNNVKLFEYPDNKKFCSLGGTESKIKEFCKNEIKIILEKINHVKKEDNSYFSGMYDGLQFLLDEEIRQKHILGSGNYPELNFKKIYDYITSDNEFIQSDIFRLRSSFYNVYLKYKIELDEEEIEVYEYEKEMDNLIHEIYIMDDDKFIKFLENIHIDKNDFNINMNINEDGLKEVFFHCLFNYKYFDKRKISFKNSEDLIFVLTTINSTRVSLSKDIINNHNITESLFKNNYIINLHKSESLFDTISTLKNFTQYQNDNNWKDLEEAMDRYVTEKDFFLHPKDIKLIKISDLKEQNLEKVLND